MKSIKKIILSVGVLLFWVCAKSQSDTASANAVQQLRIYEIFEHNKQAFHDRFRDHAWRIMKKYGFNIVSFWETKDEKSLQFVYLLNWKDTSTMKKSWHAFMADAEWKQIKKETTAKHGALVGTIKEMILYPTSYSPVKSF